MDTQRRRDQNNREMYVRTYSSRTKHVIESDTFKSPRTERSEGRDRENRYSTQPVYSVDTKSSDNLSGVKSVL